MPNFIFSLQKFYKIFYLFSCQWYDIGIILNNLIEDTQKVYNFVLSGSLSQQTFHWPQIVIHVKNNTNIWKLCHSKFHLKCSNLNYVESQYAKHSNKKWCCIKCCNKMFAFNQLNNYKLFSLLNNQSFSNTDSNENCLMFTALLSPKNVTFV